MTFPMLFFYSNFLVSKLGNGVKSLKIKNLLHQILIKYIGLVQIITGMCLSLQIR
jgi:hypothetical protein